MIPKIILSKQAYLKILYYTKAAGSDEVSGYAKTKITKDKNILVTDAIILEQECSPGATSLTAEARNKFMYELHKKKEDTTKWNLWWHSHGNGGAFWSAQDEKSSQEMGGKYGISIVTNLSGDYKAKLVVFPKDKSGFDLETFTEYDDLEVEIEVDSTQDTKEFDYKEKAKEQIAKLEKRKDAIEEKIEELEKITEKDIVLHKDTKIEKECEKEVKEKVTKPVYEGYYGGTYGKTKSKKNKLPWKWEATGFINEALAISYNDKLLKQLDQKDDINIIESTGNELRVPGFEYDDLDIYGKYNSK